MILTENVKDYCLKRRTAIKEAVAAYQPTLAVLQAGNTGTAELNQLKEECEKNGINFEWYYYEEDISTAELRLEIIDLHEHVDGIMVHKPLPKHINNEVIKIAIAPEKDINGANPIGRHSPSMVRGIIDYLTYCGFPFEGAHVVIFGKSEDFGKPLAEQVSDLGATVTLGDTTTRNIWEFIETADLIISATGKRGFLNCYAIHVPVIDVCNDCINTEHRNVLFADEVAELQRIALLDNLIEDKFVPCKSADRQCNIFCHRYAECVIEGTWKTE